MYGLPHDIDLTFFRGKTLLQVCIGAHDLILNFDGDVNVTVTSSIGCVDSSGITQNYSSFREAACAVANFLNQTAVFAEGNKLSTLILKFDGGGMLLIYDDSKDYESYTIKHERREIVV